MKTTFDRVQVLATIAGDKEIQKAIKNLNYTDNEDILRNCERYVNAVRENRIICAIGSVSKSGMSRTIKFMECAPGERYNWYNFHLLFKVFGYKESRSNRDYFTVNGCGMDMVFHTNYSIIHKMGRLGLIDKEEVSVLSQNTPHVI